MQNRFSPVETVGRVFRYGINTIEGEKSYFESLLDDERALKRVERIYDGLAEEMESGAGRDVDYGPDGIAKIGSSVSKSAVSTLNRFMREGDSAISPLARMDGRRMFVDMAAFAEKAVSLAKRFAEKGGAKERAEFLEFTVAMETMAKIAAVASVGADGFRLWSAHAASQSYAVSGGHFRNGDGYVMNAIDTLGYGASPHADPWMEVAAKTTLHGVFTQRNSQSISGNNAVLSASSVKMPLSKNGDGAATGSMRSVPKGSLKMMDAEREMFYKAAAVTLYAATARALLDEFGDTDLMLDMTVEKSVGDDSLARYKNYVFRTLGNDDFGILSLRLPTVAVLAVSELDHAYKTFEWSGDRATVLSDAAIRYMNDFLGFVGDKEVFVDKEKMERFFRSVLPKETEWFGDFVAAEFVRMFDGEEIPESAGIIFSSNGWDAERGLSSTKEIEKGFLSVPIVSSEFQSSPIVTAAGKIDVNGLRVIGTGWASHPSYSTDLSPIEAARRIASPSEIVPAFASFEIDKKAGSVESSEYLVTTTLNAVADTVLPTKTFLERLDEAVFSADAVGPNVESLAKSAFLDAAAETGLDTDVDISSSVERIADGIMSGLTAKKAEKSFDAMAMSVFGDSRMKIETMGAKINIADILGKTFFTGENAPLILPGVYGSVVEAERIASSVASLRPGAFALETTQEILSSDDMMGRALVAVADQVERVSFDEIVAKYKDSDVVRADCPSVPRGNFHGSIKHLADHRIGSEYTRTDGDDSPSFVFAKNPFVPPFPAPEVAKNPSLLLTGFTLGEIWKPVIERETESADKFMKKAYGGIFAPEAYGYRWDAGPEGPSPDPEPET